MAMINGPSGVTGWGGPVGGSPEMEEMEKAMRCVNALEPLAMPIHTRTVLASIAISARKQHEAITDLVQQQQALLQHYAQRATEHRALRERIGVMWWLCGMAIGANVMAIILRAFD